MPKLHILSFLQPTVLKFCLLGALDRFMLIYSVYIMFFAKIGLTPAVIGMVLAFYEVGKIFGDPIFAVLADKYGRKTLIVMGFIFKAIGVLSWVVFPGVVSAFVGVFLIGAGKSGVSNIDSYMYDEFKAIGIDNQFRNAVAMKSIFTNLSASIGGYTASGLYKLGGFEYVFLASVFIIIFVSVPYITFCLKDAKDYTKNNINRSIIAIIQNGLTAVKQNSKIFYAIMLISFFYSGYIIYTDTNKMVMNDIGFTPDFIARVYATAHIIPVITTFIFLLFRPGLLIRGVVTIAIIIWIGICVTSYIMYGKPLVATMLIYLFMFPIFDTCIRDNLHRLISDSSVRATILSFSHLISSGINIFASLLVGFIAHGYSYRYSVIVFSLFMVISTIIIMVIQRINIGNKILRRRAVI